MSDNQVFERPQLERSGPQRGAGNYYRASAGRGSDNAAPGLPLNSPEAAVVAAVRLAYKVAEAQVDRSARLAKRLRRAGDDTAGPGSDRQALDATEQLIFKGMMSALSWLEGAAASRGGNPLKRVLVAQYRLVGATLGLTSAEDRKSAPVTATDDDAPARTVAPVEGRAAGRTRQARTPLQIEHTEKNPRPVRVRGWDYSGALPSKPEMPVCFYRDGGRRKLDGFLTVPARGAATLQLKVPGTTSSGNWRAAIVDGNKMQAGYIEIEI